MNAIMGRLRDVAWRLTTLRVTGLVASIAAIAFLRYITGPSQSLPHELSLRLYYLPILMGAYWYGPAGGLLVAFASSVAYVHRMLAVTTSFDASRYAEVVV